jgi:hypothetical protein
LKRSPFGSTFAVSFDHIDQSVVVQVPAFPFWSVRVSSIRWTAVGVRQ